MAVLKVTVKEELVLNGKDMGNENFLSISGVENAEHRIVSVGTSEQSILLFGSALSAGTVKDATVKHLRLTNLDSTNKIIIRVEDSSTPGQYYVDLEPGETFILGNSVMYADNANSSGETLVAIDAIYATADSASSDLEMFIATN
jgi:hypothetical protein